MVLFPDGLFAGRLVDMPPGMAGDRVAQKESRLLRAIAGALTADPSMSYQRLADTVGVGRRTLYRLAPSREELLERLRQEAVAANLAALDKALSSEGTALDALIDLTDDFIDDADLYGFWTADSWGKGPLADQASASNADLDHYRSAMTRLFSRGQQEGSIRADLPMIWLIHAYDGMLLAAAGSRQGGSVPPDDLARLVMEMFLNGAGPVRQLG